MTIPATFAGAIFDVDETLLDTNVNDPVNGLHELARLQATHEAGRRHNIPELIALTPAQNLQAFLTAPVHTLESAVWNSLVMMGVESTRTIDPQNPLLLEIVARKDELFEEVLRTKGKPVPGAVHFIKALGTYGLTNKMAIASTARRQDIDTFIEMIDAGTYFPPERIISKSDVTHPKPNPEAFDKAFQLLGLPDKQRGHVLAFEDNPRGVMSAKAAGLFTCAITTVNSREVLMNQAVVPDLVAASFAEFETLLGLA
jgi:beta-phosphoglucomutase-like phosphatase (HAD superfamily)